MHIYSFLVLSLVGITSYMHVCMCRFWFSPWRRGDMWPTARSEGSSLVGCDGSVRLPNIRLVDVIQSSCPPRCVCDCSRCRRGLMRSYSIFPPMSSRPVWSRCDLFSLTMRSNVVYSTANTIFILISDIGAHTSSPEWLSMTPPLPPDNCYPKRSLPLV